MDLLGAVSPVPSVASKARRLLSFPAFLLWGAPFVLLAPVYLSGKAIFWGTPLFQFVPWWAYAWETLLSGHLPLWNPYVGMGSPLLANYQSALLYPGTWLYFPLYLLGGARWMAWGQAILIAAHWSLAALGMAALARRLGLNGTAQAVGGLAFGLSGYLVARAGFLSINAAAAWLPWVIWSATPPSVDGRPVPRRASVQVNLGLAAVLALQLLAGHAQTTWYTLLLAGAWIAFWECSSAEYGWRLRLRGMAAGVISLALSAMLAAGVAAVQLLPTAELLAQSQRSTAVDFEFAMNYSFWPWRLLTLFAPDLFGSPATPAGYWGYATYWEDAIYVGVLPLLLAIAALVSSLRPRRASSESLPIVERRSFAVFLAGLIFVALLMALGRFTPVYPWLYRHVPTFSMFQGPARWMLWAVFALALLAALGVHRWRRPRGRGLYWTRLAAAGAFAITLGAGAGRLVLGDVTPTFISAMALFGIWALGTAVLGLVAPKAEVLTAGRSAVNGGDSLPEKLRSGPSRLWCISVAAWVALDLVVAGWGLNPGASLDLYGPAPNISEVRPLVAGGRLHTSRPQENWLKYTRFLRFESFWPREDWLAMRSVHLPNANMLDHLPVTGQFDPLVPAWYAAWQDLLADASPDLLPQLYDWMDVRVIQSLDRHAPDGVRYTPRPGAGRVRLVTCAWWAADTAEARQMIAAHGRALSAAVVLEQPPDNPQLAQDCSAAAPAALDALQWMPDGPNCVTLRYHAPASGWLVIADTWYPGWSATLDGRETPLLRANSIFRAIQTPAGEHEVVLTYRPRPFYAGVMISLLALALAVGLWKKNAHRSGG